MSQWTYLCENLSIQLCRKIDLKQCCTQQEFTELKIVFLDVLEDILLKPLTLANARKQHFSETRYLCDRNLTISDLLIFFSLNLIFKYLNIFSNIGSFSKIETWYSTMTRSKQIMKFEEVLNCFKNCAKCTNSVLKSECSIFGSIERLDK